MEDNIEQSDDEYEPRWSGLILAIGVTVTLGMMVPVGYSFGVVNALSEIIQNWFYYNIEYRYLVTLSESKIRLIWHSIVSLYVMGGIIASLISAWYCDRYGRKGTLIIAGFLLLMSSFFVSFCKYYHSIEMLIIGRVVGGIAACFTITAQPMYLLEITPPAFKGTMGSLTSIGMTAGIVLSQISTLPNFLGNEERWPYGFGAFGILVLLFLLASYWLPESPRWLYLIKNDPYKAEINLKKLWKNSIIVKKELASIRTHIVYEEQQGLIAALCDKELLKPFILVCSFQICQQMSGINGIFYYSVEAFVNAGASQNFATLTNLCLGCVNLCASLFTPVIINMVDRRPMLLTSFAGCCISLLVVASTLAESADNLFWKGVVVLSFMIIYLIFYQMGVGPIPFFIGSEIFDMGPRSAAMSMGSLCNWSSNFLVAMWLPNLFVEYGTLSFLICAAVCLYGFLLAYFLLPETRNKTTQEIASSFANRTFVKSFVYIRR